MWWFFFLFLFVVFVVVSILGALKLKKMSTTALVIVHPYNLGSDEAEMRANVRKMRSMGLATLSDAFIVKHLEFYKTLSTYLQNTYYGHVVILEESHRVQATLQLIDPLLKASWLSTFNLLPKLITVATIKGRATPSGDVTWKDLSQSLRSLGIRRIEIVGCYLGLKEEQMVYDPKLYGNFCVNEAFAELTHSGQFLDVDVIRGACYEHQAVVQPEAIYLLERRKKKKK